MSTNPHEVNNTWLIYQTSIRIQLHQAWKLLGKIQVSLVSALARCNSLYGVKLWPHTELWAPYTTDTHQLDKSIITLCRFCLNPPPFLHLHITVKVGVTKSNKQATQV